MDDTVEVSSDDARTMANRLSREEGLFCGMSSGANVHCAIEYAKRSVESSGGSAGYVLEFADLYIFLGDTTQAGALLDDLEARPYLADAFSRGVRAFRERIQAVEKRQS